MSLVKLVYRPDSPEDGSKEDEFCRQSMEGRWRAGYHDPVHALRHLEVLERAPGCDAGFDLMPDDAGSTTPVPQVIVFAQLLVSDERVLTL